MARTEYGLQMYSLHDITKGSMRLALERVAEMGYKYVEFAGFFDYMPEQIKLWLDTFGLTCSSTHTEMRYITPETIDETIRYHKIIGCKNLIVPECDWSTPEKAKAVVDALNIAQKKLAENGITLGYHNHSKEFFPNAHGIVFEDMVKAETTVDLQIDTWWAFNAGLDVVKFLEENKDRIRIIHLKDGIACAPNCKNFDHVRDGVRGLSVGSGQNVIPEIRKWAIANGVLMVVESEGLDPTGLEEVGRCMEYLRTLDD